MTEAEYISEFRTRWPRETTEDVSLETANLDEAFQIARQAVAKAPVLIPICSHRFLPAEPCEAGNPVFSIHQTDIIYYGSDLLDYLQNEFSYYFQRSQYHLSGKPRAIRFWS